MRPCPVSSPQGGSGAARESEGRVLSLQRLYGPSSLCFGETCKGPQKTLSIGWGCLGLFQGDSGLVTGLGPGPVGIQNHPQRLYWEVGCPGAWQSPKSGEEPKSPRLLVAQALGPGERRRPGGGDDSMVLDPVH